MSVGKSGPGWRAASPRGQRAKWGYVFYEDDGDVPAADFLAALPPNVRRQFFNTLDAVLLTPHPPRAYLPNRWHSMKKVGQVDMGDFFEARDQHGKTNYRLFCRFDSAAAATLGAPVLVLISGSDKPERTAMDEREYERARALWTRYDQNRHRSSSVSYPPAKLPPSPRPGV